MLSKKKMMEIQKFTKYHMCELMWFFISINLNLKNI